MRRVPHNRPKWVRAEARRRGVEITLVLDFIHALEYLWKAAHAFFDRGTPEIETWVLERLERMLEGRISHVVAGMTHPPPTPAWPD